MDEIIVEFRRKYNLTQKQLAKELGVSNKTIWRWENRKSRVPIIMPATLRGLRLILKDRRSQKNRYFRNKLRKEQDRQYEREKTLSSLPDSIKMHLDSNR